MQEAYDMYVHIAQKPVLSHDQFRIFWNALSDEEREWWLADFRTGKTTLNGRFAKIGHVSGTSGEFNVPPTLQAKIEEAMNMMS
jgi:hypothetical protein